jgi:hypothetical protein
MTAVTPRASTRGEAALVLVQRYSNARYAECRRPQLADSQFRTLWNAFRQNDDGPATPPEHITEIFKEFYATAELATRRIQRPASFCETLRSVIDQFLV